MTTEYDKGYAMGYRVATLDASRRTLNGPCSTLREEVKHVIRDMEEMRAQGILYHREYNWIRGIETRLRNAVADRSNATGEGRGIPRTLDPIVGNLDSGETE